MAMQLGSEEEWAAINKTGTNARLKAAPNACMPAPNNGSSLVLDLQRSYGNRAVQNLLQRQAAPAANTPTAAPTHAPASAKAASLKDKKIGQWEDETALTPVDKSKLTDSWGAATQAFGGDPEIEAYLAMIVARLAERGKKQLAQGSPRAQAQLSQAALQEEYRLLTRFHHKASSAAIQGFKYDWLLAMPSRLDAACISQPGINYDNWTFSPYLVKAPSAEETKPIPASIPLLSESKKNASDAMVAFLEKLEPVATAQGYFIGLQNRQPHSNGWGADFYLVNKQGSTTPESTQGAGSEGFWDPDRAAGFLKLFHQAATEAGVRWHVIYNDPRVAQEVNMYYKAQGKLEDNKSARVAFGGSYRSKNGDIERNYHGPIVLHFHVDIIWNKEHVRPTPASPAAAVAPSP